MENETRNHKLLRELNDEIEEKKTTINNMSPAEKWAMSIVVMAVAVAICIMLLWSAFARAEEMAMEIHCEGEVCTVSKKEIKLLIEHNNAVTRLLKAEKAKPCNTLSNI